MDTNKKIFLVAGIIVLIIIMISFASAGMGWDNIKIKQDKTFDGKNVLGNKLLERYKPIKIKNNLGIGKTLFEGYISKHKEKCSTNCESIIEIKTYEIAPLIDNIKFYTKQKDNEWKEQKVREYNLYLWTKKTKGGGYYWKEYFVGETKTAGQYKIKIEAKKKPSRIVDWRIETQGKTITSWAVWGGLFEGTEYQLSIITSEIDKAGIEINGVLVTELTTGIYKINTTNANDEISRALIMKTLFYGTNGNDPRATKQYINTTEIYSNNQKDKGKRGTFARLLYTYSSGLGDDPNNARTWTGTFTDTTNNFDCSSWSYTWGNGYSFTSINEIGTDTSADEINNPTTVQLEAYNWNPNGRSQFEIASGTIRNQATATNYATNQANVEAIILCSGNTTWTNSTWIYEPLETYENKDFYIEEGFPEIIFPEGTIRLEEPTNNYLTPTTQTNFSAYTEVVGGSNITNITFCSDITGTWDCNNNDSINITNQTLTNYTYTITKTISGTTKWNMKVCDTDEDCGMSLENYTLYLDNTKPIINITQPQQKINFGKEGKEIGLEWDITENNLDICWYEYEGINKTINCNSTTETFTINNVDNRELTFYANDTVSNLGTKTINWTYYLWEEGTEFNLVAPEVSEQQFTINLSLVDNDTINIAKFWYGNNSYSPDIILNGNKAILTYQLTTPNVLATTNYTFFWQITINPEINTTEENQTIIGISFDNCSNNTEIVINYTLVNEVTETPITNENSTIEIDITMYTEGGTEILTYSNIYENTSYAPVCMNELLNETTYKIDITTSYVADNYVQEFWYLNDGTLEINNSQLNEYTTKTPILRATTLDDSTTFLFQYLDEIYSIKEGAIVTVLRKYIGQGVFKEAERCLQDSNGECHLHLTEEDVIYKFRVTIGGVLEYLSEEYNAKCLDVLCQITLTKPLIGGEWDSQLDDLEEGTYTVSSDKDTRTVTVDFNLNETGVMGVKVYEYDQDAYTDTLIVEDTTTAKIGSVEVIIPLVYGNKTYYAVVEHDNTFVSTQWVDMSESGYQYFGTLGLFLAGLLIITLGLIAVTSGSWTIIFIILGMIVSSVTKLVDMDLYLMMWVISAGGLIVWKLSSRRSA